jgi:hypothetical protein
VQAQQKERFYKVEIKKLAKVEKGKTEITPEK